MDVSPLHRFVEKVVDVLGHDLRSPLGAVITYASLLEDDPAPAVDDVHDFAGRIRARATEVTEWTTLAVEALLIVARRPSPVLCDPAALLRSIASEIDGNLDVDRSGGGDGEIDVELETAPVGFVWRAFLRLDGGVRARPPRDLRVRAQRQGRVATVDVGLDGALDARLPVVALDRFLRSAERKVTPSSRLALELGGEMIGCCGGGFELFGSPGKSAGIRLTLPQPG